MSLPKLEGLITVPTGGWTFTLTEASAGYVGPVTIPAGDYYMTTIAPGGTRSLADEIEYQMDVVGRDYYITVDDDADTSTGVVNLRQKPSGVGTTFAITFTATALRDALGFTGNLSGTYNYNSTRSSVPLWLPNCQRVGDHPDPLVGAAHFGRPRSDLVMTRAPSGAATGLTFNTLYESDLQFPSVLGRKAWVANETVVNESYEKFWNEVVRYGKTFRYHPDRADDTRYWTLFPMMADFAVAPMDPAWLGPTAIFSVQLFAGEHVES